MNSFDPYHKWLGIPREEQPPSHYRLLGIVPFERDPEVIEAAADRQMKYVSQCAIGEHLKLSQQLLNELSAARVCLLVPAKRQAYDAQLQAKLDEARRLENSLTPLMLDEPLSETLPRRPEHMRSAPAKRQSKPKPKTSKIVQSRRNSTASPKMYWIAAVAIVAAFVGALGLWSTPKSQSPISAVTSVGNLSKSEPPRMVQPQTNEPTRTRVAEPDGVPIRTGHKDTPVAEVQRPAAIEPAHHDEKDKNDDQEVVEAFGKSLKSTKGNAAGAVIEGSEPFSPTESFTIEFWVSTLADRGTLISKRHGDNEPSIIVHIHEGVPNLSIAIGGGERGSGGGLPINDGKWHHVAIVKRMDLLTLFVDGHKTVQTNESTSMTSPSPWVYGASYFRTPCAARFGGIRISSSARYDGPFEPKKRHVMDGDTLLQQ